MERMLVCPNCVRPFFVVANVELITGEEWSRYQHKSCDKIPIGETIATLRENANADRKINHSRMMSSQSGRENRYTRLRNEHNDKVKLVLESLAIYEDENTVITF